MSENNENNTTNEQQGVTETQEVERFVEKNGEKLEVSENFWDKEKNAPDVYSILKSQQDLRKQLGEDLSPKDGVYQINIPEEFKDKLQPDPEQPLFKEFSAWAKKNRMSQADFDKISQIYYKDVYESLKDTPDNQITEEEYFKLEAEKLKEKYGDRLDRMKTRIDNFISNSGISDEDIINELAFMQTSAAGVATLDYLLGLRGEPMPSSEGAGSRTGVMSLEELRNLQAKPEYYTDKTLQEKVQKGYEQLYAGR